MSIYKYYILNHTGTLFMIMVKDGIVAYANSIDTSIFTIGPSPDYESKLYKDLGYMGVSKNEFEIILGLNGFSLQDFEDKFSKYKKVSSYL